MTTITRGLRNRNPGNLEYGSFTVGIGATGSDGRFAIFPTMVKGIEAICRNLLAYQKFHGIDTVEAAINRWAPNNENHTEAYIALVCAVLECNRSDHFNFSDPDFLFWMATAIGEEENGVAAFTEYVKDVDIDAGIAAALRS